MPDCWRYGCNLARDYAEEADFVGYGGHNRIHEVGDFSDLNTFRIGNEDNIAVSHLYLGAQEVAARIMEIDAEDHRNDIAVKPRHIGAKQLGNVARLPSIEEYRPDRPTHH